MTWIITQIQKLWNAISKVFTAKLFEFGDQAFSLSFLGKFLFLCIIAIIISRTIKTLIKHWLLSRFRMDRGTREALASIIGYILTILGFLIVLQTSGINLSSLAIFAGALGIGFGIGLQDLASNFISGLTILLDQPIKVGDYIEIDNLSGTVEKISIRSTVVRTIHNVCVIIPNNSFCPK
ncbi:mechanosensitive ion channel family protein [Moorena producens]|uniref:mechanosensitive ion channel family protein n=1 Tax=Moorena producens TaxID=1155739 RepID=UPI003C792A09